MRRSRLLTVVLGALLAVVLTPLLGAPGAAADPLRPDEARPADVGVAAVPRCTSWTTYYAANTTSYVVHVPSNGYNTGRYDCELRQGDQNDAVKVLQRALYYCTGATNVVIDGEYGPVTRAAVLAFQRRMNSSHGATLDEDGIYGPETEDWLKFPVWTWPGNVRVPGQCDHNPA